MEAIEIDLIRNNQILNFQKLKNLDEDKELFAVKNENPSSSSSSSGYKFLWGYDSRKNRNFAENQLYKTNSSPLISSSSLSSTSSTTTTTRTPSSSEDELEEEKISPENFQLMNIIGSGGYGKVYQVKKVSGCSNLNRTFAMKVIKKSCTSVKDQKHCRTERNILKNVQHPFIVELFYAFQTNSKLYLIMEYLNGGELFTHLERELLFSENTARFYLSEVILALEYLHSLGIIYRDLKSENILLDSEGHIKLTDFGLSKEDCYDGIVTYTFCGTIEYMAPEILMRLGYGKEVDWWSLGAVMYDMLHGSPPFTGSTRDDIIQNIIRCRLYFPKHFTREAQTLIRGLLRKQPAKRLGSGRNGATAIKEHNFFKNICWVDVINRRLQPPFKPNVQGDDDVSQFDSKFTKQIPIDSPGNCDDNQLSESLNSAFKGFSYVAPSMLKEAANNDVNNGDGYNLVEDLDMPSPLQHEKKKRRR